MGRARCSRAFAQADRGGALLTPSARTLQPSSPHLQPSPLPLVPLLPPSRTSRGVGRRQVTSDGAFVTGHGTCDATTEGTCGKLTKVLAADGTRPWTRTFASCASYTSGLYSSFDCGGACGSAC